MTLKSGFALSGAALREPTTSGAQSGIVARRTGYFKVSCRKLNRGPSFLNFTQETLKLPVPLATIPDWTRLMRAALNYVDKTHTLECVKTHTLEYVNKTHTHTPSSTNKSWYIPVRTSAEIHLLEDRSRRLPLNPQFHGCVGTRMVHAWWMIPRLNSAVTVYMGGLVRDRSSAMSRARCSMETHRVYLHSGRKGVCTCY